jgi:hypothetical protein
MAKWAEPSEETVSEFQKVLIATGLDNFINTKIIVNDDQKKRVIVPKKMTAEIAFAFDYQLAIIINEEIFDQLPPLQKRLCIEEALSGTYYDTEGDKLVVGQPDVKTFHGFLDKHGYEQFEILEKSIKSLYDAQKNAAVVNEL